MNLVHIRLHPLIVAIVWSATLLPSFVNAQSSNLASFEILGTGGIYSVNYERRIIKHISVRVGFGTLTREVVTMPIMLNLVVRKGSRKIVI